MNSLDRQSFAGAWCLMLLLTLCSVGCQQRAASKLLGRWEGRPDSAATRAKREAEKYGDEQTKPNEGSAAKTTDSPQGTDWEDYEVTIVMDFVSSDQIQMSLAGKETITGAWTIISTSPTGCTIEIKTEVKTEEDTEVVRRRFELVLDEREGTCVGFQLAESGADPQLGSLYFQRPGSGAAVSAN